MAIGGQGGLRHADDARAAGPPLDTDVVRADLRLPSESVFSRAFAEFSDTQLPQRVHEALIWNTHRDRGGPPLSRLDGHRGPREAGREGEATSAAQAQTGTAEEG